MDSSKSSTSSQKSKKKTKGANKNKNEVPHNAPIFLRKTFEMISTCDPAIASWSDDGTAFVVKDKERFQEEIVPRFFKHKKFASFVRQLNFYGFRKVRSEALRIVDAQSDEESKYEKFHHEKFRRRRPDLLNEIRKTTQNESADKQEVEHLRQEVTTLKRRLSDMSKDVDGLKKLVGSLMPLIHEQHMGEYSRQYQTEVPAKRLRLSDDSSPYAVPSNVVVTGVTPLPALSSDSEGKGHHPALDLKPAQPSARNDSIGLSSFTSQDDALLTSLFALDPQDEINVLETPSSTIYDQPPKMEETDSLPVMPTSMPPANND